MEMGLALLPMVYIFLSLFVLLECVLMLMTSSAKLLKQGIIKFEKHCLNPTTGTQS